MIPKQYAYLGLEAGPKVLGAALADYGLKEVPGTKSNPQILSMAKELGLEREYTNDGIAWCGLAVAYWVLKAGYDPVDKPLWALNWKNFGNPADKPSLGDILVFRRKVPTGWAGHTGIYCGENDTHFFVLGGNQDDQVCISPILKSRLVAARRCPWKIGQPENVRPIRLSASGVLRTTTEA